MADPFRAYDVRGLYPEEVNEQLAYSVGRAAVTFLKAKKILVGRDCRTSSLSLKKSLVYGITDQGCNVIDTGYCNTPMVYFAAQKIHSIMITASHNPKQYNGIKITKKGVAGIGAHNGLPKVKALSEACHFKEPTKRGTVITKNILPAYVKEVRKIVNGTYNKKLHVLVDCGNGMAGYVVPTLFKGLGFAFDLLYSKLDGTFPNHTPNPVLPENTKELQKRVKKKYDIGIAYDSDCDRAFFVDENGKRIRSEYILLLFAKHLMKKGDRIVHTVNMSRIVQDKVKEWGGKPVPSPVGHTEIPLVMKKHKALLGGEITGHFYYKKFKYADSGDISALFMLSLLSQFGKTVSELVKEFEKYATAEETNFKVKDKQAAMNRVAKAYKGKIRSRLDGITVDAGSYWFNFRISKTENVVRLNCEAVNKKTLKSALQRLSKLIRA